MIKEIKMPKLGETMEEGIISKWLKNEGDRVSKGEALFEVSTDKANFEVESLASGLLRKILFPAGEKPIQVIKVIGYIADSMDEVIPSEIETDTAVKKEKLTTVIEDKIDQKMSGIDSGTSDGEVAGLAASPAAKRLAKEKGIDINKIKGTGPGGRITEKDVEKAGGGETAGQLSGMRKTIAQRMSRSKQEVPHFYLEVEIDMTGASRRKTAGITYNDIVIKAAAKALEQAPGVNAHFTNNSIIQMKEINIGVAVSVQDGLVVPVIKNADRKTLEQISSEMLEIKNKARSNKFAPDDFSNGTFTVSNLGGFGIDSFIAIINQPQVGILAVGGIKETPVVADNQVAIRKIMKVCGSFDHRAVDGAMAAEFLVSLKKILEN